MGKTESFLRHLAHHKLGTHKGAGRIWLEGQRLVDVGFEAGVRYQVATMGEQLTLVLSDQGDHVVSHKDERPVVDLLTRALGSVTRIEVRFHQGEIRITVDPLERAARQRLARLNARLAAGQPLQLGSLSHGGGVAADALLRGLGSSELAFGLDIEGRYLEASLTQGPLSRGGMSIEASIGRVDPRELPQVDVLEAGLPCVAASKAGRSKKHLARPEADVKVAHLVVGFLRIVEATQPAVVILENVPEYADSASADIIRAQLTEWGYEIHEHNVDGLAWSLEDRRRWVLVATTRGLELDWSQLTPVDRPATLAEVLDRRVADRWQTFDHLDAKQARDAAKGSSFKQQLLTPEATRVPTLRRGYQKAGSTDPRLVHPTRPGVSRLLTPAEHARIKGVPPTLVRHLPDTTAHEILGQSVTAPAFSALGRVIAAVHN